MHYSRIAPSDHTYNKHQHIESWLNEILFDLKLMFQAGHIPLISERRLMLWPGYRDELKDCGVLGMSGHKNRHSAAIATIDSAVEYMTAIWHKQEPEENARRLRAILTNLHRSTLDLDCRESLIKY